MKNNMQTNRGAARKISRMMEMTDSDLSAPQAEQWGSLAHARYLKLTPQVRARLASLALEAQRMPVGRYY